MTVSPSLRRGKVNYMKFFACSSYVRSAWRPHVRVNPRPVDLGNDKHDERELEWRVHMVSLGDLHSFAKNF